MATVGVPPLRWPLPRRSRNRRRLKSPEQVFSLDIFKLFLWIITRENLLPGLIPRPLLDDGRPQPLPHVIVEPCDGKVMVVVSC